MSAPSPAPWLALATALCARPAAADIVPSEAFISPAPAPWTRPAPQPAAPDAPDDVSLLEVSAHLDLFPTAALVHTTAIVHSPTGGPRRLGIPQLTPYVRAAPITGFTVLVDGVPVAPELFDARVLPPTSPPRPHEDWWSWPVDLSADKPVRIDLHYSQALTEPDARDGRLHLYAFHFGSGGAAQSTPIRDVEFTLDLHGIAADAVAPRTAPTSATTNTFVWRHVDLAPTGFGFGATVELPLADLPGRDVLRAPYFPADAPAHLAVQDYVVRFAVDCSPPTPDQWERLVELLRDTAERSDSPLARSWAAGTLRDVTRWCDPDATGALTELFESPATSRCREWLAVTAPAPDVSPDTLAPPLWCWGQTGEAEANLQRAAERARWRRSALWAGAAGAALAVAALVWIRRRRSLPQ